MSIAQGEQGVWYGASVCSAKEMWNYKVVRFKSGQTNVQPINSRSTNI